MSVMDKGKDKKFALVSDLGSTFFRIGIINSSGVLIEKEKKRIEPRQFSEKSLVEGIIDFFERFYKGKSLNLDKIDGVGISIAGAYDSGEEIIKSCFGIRLRKRFIKETLENQFKTIVNILNDGNAGVLGEKHFGVAKEMDNLVYITISTGIGGGAIVDGHLLLGKDGNAAEIGHMNIDMNYNLPCTCGEGNNHWEAYASGRNIPNFFKAWLKRKGIFDLALEHYSSEEIFKAANEGKRVVIEFLEELGFVNGKGISNVIAAYDPECVVLGGAVVLNNQEIMLKNLYGNVKTLFKMPEITVTKLGDDAPLYGAAASIFASIEL